MSLKNNPFSYETFRPNYELYVAISWFGVSIFYGIYLLFDYFRGPSQIIFYCCWAMGFYWAIPGYKRLQQTLRLAGTPLPVLTFEDLKDKIKDDAHKTDMWVGKGFIWGKDEAQNVHQLLDRDWTQIQKEALGPIYYWRFFKEHKALFFLNPFKFVHLYKETQKRITERSGQTWIHGCGPKEEDKYLPIDQTKRHSLIIGTTGSGKTRCFDLLICQAILRNETVIVIDPKADPDLQSKIARACKELHREHNFFSFNPTQPEKSVRLNLLATWMNATEIASRISKLMPSGGNAEAFKGFAWNAINSIAQAYCNILRRNPSLKDFIAFLQGSMSSVVCEVIETYLAEFMTEKDISDYYQTLKREVRENEELKGQALVKLYRNMGRPNQCVDSLIEMFEHNREHLSKMITSLIPILSMLTSGRVGEMLCPPDADDPNDIRNSLQAGEKHKSINSLIKSNAVLYIGLNSLADTQVAKAIGMLLIADITSTAGNIYNFDQIQKKEADVHYSALTEDLNESNLSNSTDTKQKEAQVRPINVFIDEAAEVTCEPLVQLLNKGRGAQVKSFLATQTIADFEVAMGSKANAEKMLANINNFICLQIQDADTAKYIAGKFPQTKIATIQHSQSQSIGADSVTASGASITQRREEKDGPLFPESLFSLLPPLEYIGILGSFYVKGRFPILVTEERRVWPIRLFNALIGKK